MKSIKEIDLHLGASKADLGKVGYFEPRLPGNLKNLSADLQTQIQARYAARLAEWNKYRGEVARLESAGLVKRQGQTIADPKSGKAFTSDYDLFDIRKGKTPRGRTAHRVSSRRQDPLHVLRRLDGAALKSLGATPTAFGASLKEIPIAENLVRPSRMSIGAIANELGSFQKRPILNVPLTAADPRAI